MRLSVQLGVAALAGAFIAWVTMAFISYAMFAAGGYTSESLVEFPPWSFFAVGGIGAMAAIALVLRGTHSPLPPWLRPAVIGGLIGVAAVVVSTLIIADLLGGSTSKGQARYLLSGLVYGVPVGMVAGVLVGLIRTRKSTAEQVAPPDRSGD